MYDIRAIQEWNRASDEAILTIPSGTTLYQGHIKITWPEYNGAKKNFWSHWEEVMKHYSSSQQNTALSSMISKVRIKE